MCITLSYSTLDGDLALPSKLVLLTGAEVVDQWYAEHKEYDYKTAGSTGIKTGIVLIAYQSWQLYTLRYMLKQRFHNCLNSYGIKCLN